MAKKVSINYSVKCSKCNRLTTVRDENIFGYRGPKGEYWNAVLCYNCEAKLRFIFNLVGALSGTVRRLKGQWLWNQKKLTGELEEVLIK
jgi:hypothetical protein